MKDRCVTTLQGFNQLLFDSTGFFVKKIAKKIKNHHFNGFAL